MSWNEHHSLSEKLAVEAELARRAGEIARADDLYKRAAVEEAAALDALPDDRQRTRGITAVSAVALSYKGRDYSAAAQLASQTALVGTVTDSAGLVVPGARVVAVNTGTKDTYETTTTAIRRAEPKTHGRYRPQCVDDFAAGVARITESSCPMRRARARCRAPPWRFEHPRWDLPQPGPARAADLIRRSSPSIGAPRDN